MLANQEDIKGYLTQHVRVSRHVTAIVDVSERRWRATKAVLLSSVLTDELLLDPLPMSTTLAHPFRFPPPIPQAALAGLSLPTQRLGYTYITCAAGGPIHFDAFDSAAVNLTQVVTGDASQLMRVFTYDTVARSAIDRDVVRACGPAIAMTVGSVYYLQAA